ncbi:hypothetical protein DACRYDRAFT_82030, partial [Dacryopinax primogenitus]
MPVSMDTMRSEEPSNKTLVTNGHAQYSASARRLIVCFDGTSNLFDEANTNVVRFVSYLKKDDMDQQQVYYQTGVGTYIKPGMFMPLTVKLAELIDDGVAWDLSAHIMGGYRFLMQNWTPGSKISIFGFSRGAYTARALAGMLQKVGLLPRGNDEQIPFAYNFYANDSAEGYRMSTGFKRVFCHQVTVDFLGVWDTVASVGLFSARDLPFSTQDHHIRVFRHAVSLDEHRVKFKENLWHFATGPPDSTPAGHPSLWTTSTSLDRCAPTPFATDSEEVWFSGGHGDLGGGAVKNYVQSSPNRIPLVWLIREVVLANTGIQFNQAALDADGIRLPVMNPPKDGRDNW